MYTTTLFFLSHILSCEVQTEAHGTSLYSRFLLSLPFLSLFPLIIPKNTATAPAEARTARTMVSSTNREVERDTITFHRTAHRAAPPCARALSHQTLPFSLSPLQVGGYQVLGPGSSTPRRIIFSLLLFFVAVLLFLPSTLFLVPIFNQREAAFPAPPPSTHLLLHKQCCSSFPYFFSIGRHLEPANNCNRSALASSILSLFLPVPVCAPHLFLCALLRC